MMTFCLLSESLKWNYLCIYLAASPQGKSTQKFNDVHPPWWNKRKALPMHASENYDIDIYSSRQRNGPVVPIGLLQRTTSCFLLPIDLQVEDKIVLFNFILCIFSWSILYISRYLRHEKEQLRIYVRSSDQQRNQRRQIRWFSSNLSQKKNAAFLFLSVSRFLSCAYHGLMICRFSVHRTNLLHFLSPFGSHAHKYQAPFKFWQQCSLESPCRRHTICLPNKRTCQGRGRSASSDQRMNTVCVWWSKHQNVWGLYTTKCDSDRSGCWS